jgi:hypothetical protein
LTPPQHWRMRCMHRFSLATSLPTLASPSIPYTRSPPSSSTMCLERSMLSEFSHAMSYCVSIIMSYSSSCPHNFKKACLLFSLSLSLSFSLSLSPSLLHTRMYCSMDGCGTTSVTCSLSAQTSTTTSNSTFFLFCISLTYATPPQVLLSSSYHAVIDLFSCAYDDDSLFFSPDEAFNNFVVFRHH